MIKSKEIYIGAIFTIVSFISTFSIVVPMYTVMPAALIEQAASNSFPFLTAAKTGITMILLLFSLLVMALIVTFYRIKKLSKVHQRQSTIEIIGFMLTFWLFAHSLGFYLFWGVVQNFSIDALYLISSVYSFPFSSFFFIFVGFLMYKYQVKCQKKYDA